MFWYGHPLVNQGAGRIKTDSVNEERIETVLNRFEDWASERGILKNFKYAVEKEQLTKSKVVFPLAGLAVSDMSKVSSACWPHTRLCTLTQTTLESSSHCLLQAWDTTFNCIMCRHTT